MTWAEVREGQAHDATVRHESSLGCGGRIFATGWSLSIVFGEAWTTATATSTTEPAKWGTKRVLAVSHSEIVHNCSGLSLQRTTCASCAGIDDACRWRSIEE